MAKFLIDLTALKKSNFRILACGSLISGAGNALIPIAFAIETTRVEPRGWGIACVLIALWAGRFLGLLAYKRIGFRTHPILTMIWASLFMCLAQFGLLLWIWAFSNGILAMSVSSFVYGLAAAFFMPSQFVTIPLITSEGIRTQANSLLSIVGDIYAIIGPLLGASLVIWLGFEFVLIFDAITFCIAMALLRALYASEKFAHNDWQEAPPSQDKELRTSAFQILPVWTHWGLLSWFFCSLAIGLVGVAGPTLILAHHSPLAWALVAAAMACGSLAGSAVSLAGLAKKVPWPGLHVLCGLLLGFELAIFSQPAAVWALCLAGFLGAACVTTSGIRWDTIGQSLFTGKRLHAFASLDQFASTAGVTAGMILFGLSGLTGGTELAVLVAAGAAFLFTLPVLVSAWLKAGSEP